ncbi:putative cytokinetic ring protein SteA [Nocardioides sp. CER19]|uniref:putative cytokinetic ring protein SteA n=1 Tax=Nocardioides sp. CER19 TaxID=3038538 RepID=UPI00244D03DE|nr:putative cytokinetic ring protein SteA [Nocardioides sp. CER19]MDH2415569.1 putative cytokinetic ring protein SteA [Nocardioides sp. CER19]
MRLPSRSSTATDLGTGVRGAVRAGRPTRSLLNRLEPGDVAVIDHLDLDQGTARAIVDARVAAVVNAQPMISGRYANLGPEILAEAGIVLVEGIGGSAFARLAETDVATVRDGGVYDGAQLIAEGRALDLDDVRLAMAEARAGLAAQLETFTHNSSELLRREQHVLLDGSGLPMLHTPLDARPVVVVAQARPAELAQVKRFVREQRPVVVAVDAAAARLRKAGIKPDVVVLSGAESLPEAKVLRGARDVVVVQRADAAPGVTEGLARMGISPHLVATTVSTEDAALLVANAGRPSLVVGVGLTATLEDFLDRRRSGLAGSYLTRLVLGPRLVDAAALPLLYTGRVRPWHVGLSVLAGLAAVAASIATTAVGHDWAQQLVELVR